MEHKDHIINDTASVLKVQNASDLAKRASQVQNDLHSAKKEIESLNAKIASSKLDSILAGAQKVGSTTLVCASLKDMQPDAARNLADEVRSSDASAVVVFALVNGDKLNFITACGKDAVAAGAHAGKLVGSIAAIAGGKGGGRPDSAMAGGKDLNKVDEALASAKAALEGMLK